MVHVVHGEEVDLAPPPATVSQWAQSHKTVWRQQSPRQKRDLSRPALRMARVVQHSAVSDPRRQAWRQKDAWWTPEGSVSSEPPGEFWFHLIMNLLCGLWKVLFVLVLFNFWSSTKSGRCCLFWFHLTLRLLCGLQEVLWVLVLFYPAFVPQALESSVCSGSTSFWACLVGSGMFCEFWFHLTQHLHFNNWNSPTQVSMVGWVSQVVFFYTEAQEPRLPPI